MTTTSPETYRVEPGGTLRGELRVPGDKSISHRAVMFGALAEGVTEVTGFLTGEDCLCTMRAFRQMGVRVDALAPDHLRVFGAGLHGLQAPTAPLDLGNSGTSMRLMAGLMSAQKFATTLVGDASLSRRPMKRIIEPLTRMGARIDSVEGRAPLNISPVAGLRAISHRSAVASAQVKSGVLLAGLYAEGRTEVFEPEASRDHTERMLRSFGVEVDARAGYAAVTGGQRLQAAPVEVPADISSAAFFMVGAALAARGEVILRGVGINPTRTGVLAILEKMGADLQVLDARTQGGEPVADIRVRASSLHGIEIGGELVAAAIDEFPILFIAAACAEGETLIRDAEELRVKESDRIQSMVDGLLAVGIDAEALPDGARIRGGQIRGGTVDSRGDHRIAMSFAMAALRSQAPIVIQDCANVATSFPGFAALAAGAGLGIRVERGA
jgi:3-phosphoshikimate 1-carboxyvinyltransferase